MMEFILNFVIDILDCTTNDVKMVQHDEIK